MSDEYRRAMEPGSYWVDLGPNSVYEGSVYRMLGVKEDGRIEAEIIGPHAATFGPRPLAWSPNGCRLDRRATPAEVMRAILGLPIIKEIKK